MRGSWSPNRTATYWPPLLWPSVFLSRSPGLLNRGPGSQLIWVLVFSTASYFLLVWSPNWLIGGLRAPSAGCWFSLPHLVSNWSGLQTAKSGAWELPLLGAGFLYRILSTTGLVFLSSPSYIIVQRTTSSCGCHKLHSFSPSTVKATLCSSSTGCICYLHRYISYFDSPAGSLVNIQHPELIFLHTVKWYCYLTLFYWTLLIDLLDQLAGAVE